MGSWIPLSLVFGRDTMEANTYTSAITKASIQMAKQMAIHVSHPVHEWDVICFEWTPFLRNLSNSTVDVHQRRRAAGLACATEAQLTF